MYRPVAGCRESSLLESAAALTEVPDGAGVWSRAALDHVIAAILDAAVAATAGPLRATRGGTAVTGRCRNDLREHLADPGVRVPGIAAALGYDAEWLGQTYGHLYKLAPVAWHVPRTMLAAEVIEVPLSARDPRVRTTLAPPLDPRHRQATVRP